MPKVVNLSGRKSKVIGDDEVYIGHRWTLGGWRLPESKWANPFKIGRDGTREEVIALYERSLRSKPELIAALPQLRGKNLACWCAPLPCHGDVVARLVELEAKGEL
jgi:Domain of unknown function (DUF4326)